MNRSIASVFLLMFIAVLASCQTPEQKAAQYDKSFNKGWELTQKGEFAAAIPYYQKAIRALPHDPKAAEAYNNLGWSLQKKGDYQGAISAYEKALQLRPNYELARNNLNEARRQLGASQPTPTPSP